jgi:hypothetical protein
VADRKTSSRQASYFDLHFADIGYGHRLRKTNRQLMIMSILAGAVVGWRSTAATGALVRGTWNLWMRSDPPSETLIC